MDIQYKPLCKALLTPHWPSALPQRQDCGKAEGHDPVWGRYPEIWVSAKLVFMSYNVAIGNSQNPLRVTTAVQQIMG
jgi:hypothetical protein